MPIRERSTAPTPFDTSLCINSEAYIWIWIRNAWSPWRPYSTRLPMSGWDGWGMMQISRIPSRTRSWLRGPFRNSGCWRCTSSWKRDDDRRIAHAGSCRARGDDRLHFAEEDIQHVCFRQTGCSRRDDTQGRGTLSRESSPRPDGVDDRALGAKLLVPDELGQCHPTTTALGTS